MEEIGSDGLKRAKWVDCGTNPKKHGEFEGHLKGEPHKIHRYLWTGRRWMFWKPALGRKKAGWVPSIFGEPGDKWRGLAEDPNLKSIAPQESSTEAPSAENCECNLRTKLVGDGCETCNPEKAAEYSQEATAETAGESNG
jgi:hypothetical protein